MGARRTGRESALQMLYQMEASHCSADEAIRLFWLSFPRTSAEAQLGDEDNVDPNEKDGEEFANAIVRGFDDDHEKVDELIRAVSQHWRLERMTRVDRNVLRVGTWELLRCEDIPRRVTLNESIELAKRFGTETSAAFVNGVLDRIASDLQKD